MKTKAIIESINNLFGDTSVAPETTLAMLEEIRDAVEQNIEALKSDLKK